MGKQLKKLLSGVLIISCIINSFSNTTIWAEEILSSTVEQDNLINESTYDENQIEIKQETEQKNLNYDHVDEEHVAYFIEENSYEGLEINSVGVSNKVILQHEENTQVYIDVKNQYYIDSVNIVYQDKYGEYKYNYLHYNSYTDRYEGDVYSSNFYDLQEEEYRDINFVYFQISAYTGNDYEYITIYRDDLINYYNIDPSELDFRIERWKPTINSIELKSSNIYPNIEGADTIEMYMDIHEKDDIYCIGVEYLNANNNYENQYVYLYYNWENEKFEGRTTPSSYFFGEKIINRIIFYKNYGYPVTLYRNDLNNYGVDLDSLNIMIEPYQPVSINVSNKIIKPRESSKIQVDLSNYLLDIKEVRLKYKINNENYFYIDTKYNSKDGVYEGLYSASKFTEGGLKELYAIEIISENNINTIYNYGYEVSLESGNITVDNDINKVIYPLEVEVDKNKVDLNGRVKLSINGVELINGDVYATFINTRTNQTRFIQFYYNRITSKWEGYFNVDRYMSSGLWTWDSIGIGESVVDTSWNSWASVHIYNRDLYYNQPEYKYTKNLSNIDVTVSGTIEDTKAPELISITVDKKEVKPGDEVKVIIDAKDDISGIKNIYVQYSLKYPGFSINNFVYNKETKKYEGTFKVSSLNPNREYGIGYIELVDNLNNYITIANLNFLPEFGDIAMDLSAGSLKIINSISNIDEIISSVKVSENQPQLFDDIKIELELLDNKCIQKISLDYTLNDNYSNNKNIILSYNEETEKYETNINIDETWEIGEWNLKGISFYNEVGMIECIYRSMNEEKFKAGDLSVINKKGFGLKINKITTNKSSVTIDEGVDILIDTSAENGNIKKVYIEYISQGGSKKLLPLYNTGNGFAGQFKIDKYTESGKWKINYIILEDNERNREIFYNTNLNSRNVGVDFSEWDIEVYGTITDNKAPELIDIRVDKERVLKGELVKISVKAKDDGSGINSIKASFGDPGAGFGGTLLDFIYNKETEMYECVIDTSEPYLYDWSISKSGWTMIQLIIEDNVGNKFNEYRLDNKLIASTYFYVDKTNEWIISEITDESTSITGITESNATVKISIGDKSYIGVASDNGIFDITIPKQEGGTEVEIEITNTSDYIIQLVKKIVIDINSPKVPVLNTEVNNKTTVLEGKAEAGSTVIIEKEVKVFGGVKIQEITRTTADKNGNFRVEIPAQAINTVIGVKSVDNSGNESEYGILVVKNINRADINSDEVVNILDIACVARYYNTMIGNEEWNADLDVNEDEVVDIFDIILVSKQMK